jgi:hypothetical protein
MEAGRRSIHVFWWLLALTLLMPASTQAALPQMGTLNVVAQFIFRGRGDLPIAGTRAAASGLEVWVVPVGQGSGPPVARGSTDADGLLTLQVPPGSYWIFIPPLPADAPDPARRVGVTTLPDGTPSLEWWTVADVTAGTAVRAELSLDVPPAN